MSEGKHGNTASGGDRLVRVTCRCGSVWVQTSRVESWSCRCGRRQLGEEIVLGPGGRIPTKL